MRSPGPIADTTRPSTCDHPEGAFTARLHQDSEQTATVQWVEEGAHLDAGREDALHHGPHPLSSPAPSTPGASSSRGEGRAAAPCSAGETPPRENGGSGGGCQARACARSCWCVSDGPWETPTVYWAGLWISSTILYWGIFFIFILKKQNFKNICRIGKFLKMGASRPPNGRQDLNVKKNYI